MILMAIGWYRTACNEFLNPSYCQNKSFYARENAFIALSFETFHINVIHFIIYFSFFSDVIYLIHSFFDVVFS